jgi:hypothetical protein
MKLELGTKNRPEFEIKQRLLAKIVLKLNN